MNKHPHRRDSVRIRLIIAVTISASALVGAAEPQAAVATGFEGVDAGPFDQVSTDVGLWTTLTGKARIDHQHAKSGNQCLQLAGGPATTVTLVLKPNAADPQELSFWAERWTSRAPFSFRIHAETPDGWTQIYRGDDRVKVGRSFLNHVRVPLVVGTSRLKFTVTSPPDTGLLIDDLRIAPMRPQRVVEAKVIPHVLPVLVGEPSAPLLKLEVKTEGQLKPLSWLRLQASLSGNVPIDHVESLQLWQSDGDDPRFSRSRLVARLNRNTIDTKFVFEASSDTAPFSDGNNYLWIACALNAQADLDHVIGATCQSIQLSTGETNPLDTPKDRPATNQRLGLALRKSGDDGTHTYRIPGLVTTQRGTLIAVYDARHRSSKDLPADVDVGMSRSTDGGRSWEPMKLIMDMGKDPKWRYDGIGDPAILVDDQTGTIWVAATWSHGDRSWHGSGPGLTPEETGQLMLVRSTDDGVTWSRPVNITRQIKRPEWSFVLQGPGMGITMQDGTLVFAAQFQDSPTNQRLPRSTIIYSKDRGETWSIGTGAWDDTTEAQVVELHSGELMLNCRYNRDNTRVVVTTRDLGKTWAAHPTSQRSLIEPRACMASLIRLTRTGLLAKHSASPQWLAFANPNSKNGRNHITIKLSPDAGQSWPERHQQLLDEGDGRGYSCLTRIDDDTLGILYEGSLADLTFQRIPISELIGETP